MCVLNRNINEQKYIQPEKLQEYLDKGWVRGCKKKVFDDEKVCIKKIQPKTWYKYIKKSQLQEHLDNGWVLVKQHKISD